MEDVDRDANKDGDIKDPGEEKVFGETAIPSGTYKMIVNMSLSKKRMLPRILNVPGFDGILVHRGNSKKDSYGCILVGYQRGDDFIGTSKIAELDLVKELQKYTEIVITIQ